MGLHTLIPSALGLFEGFGSVQAPRLLGKESRGYTLALGPDCYSSTLFQGLEPLVLCQAGSVTFLSLF